MHKHKKELSNPKHTALSAL